MVPTHKLFAIPTPPANVADPVVVEVASVVLVCDVIPVIVVEANEVANVTDNAVADTEGVVNAVPT